MLVHTRPEEAREAFGLEAESSAEPALEPVTGVASRDGWHPVIALIAGFLVLFGVMNFAELPLGWKDRSEQIGRYLSATVGLGSAWVLPALWAVKTVEGVLGLTALIGLVRRDARWIIGTIFAWMTIMTGFAGVDVWAADRAELQEHTVYFAAFAQMLLVVVVLQGASSLRRRWGLEASQR